MTYQINFSTLLILFLCITYISTGQTSNKCISNVQKETPPIYAYATNTTKIQNHEIITTNKATEQYNPSKENNKLFLKSLYLGGNASTNGLGGSVRFIINRWFAFRAGYETIDLSFDNDFSESDIEYTADIDFKTGGLSLLADLNFSKNFYLSGGVLFNSFNPHVKGYAISDYKYGDIILAAEDIGEFSFDIKSKVKASPYASLGLRAFFGKKDRIAMNFETGIYYIGGPEVEIEATGLLAPTSDPSLGQKENIENQFDAYKIYPVVKLGFEIKLF